jgi:hypothetical protein
VAKTFAGLTGQAEAAASVEAVEIAEEVVVREAFGVDFATEMEWDASRTDYAHGVVDGHSPVFAAANFVGLTSGTEVSQYR